MVVVRKYLPTTNHQLATNNFKQDFSMTISRSVVAGVLSMIVAAGCKPAASTPPETALQPTVSVAPATTVAVQSGGDELLQSKAAMPGYGLESYRIVSDRDEIVSVLRNGMVVIVKRVASPVAAVRGSENSRITSVPEGRKARAISLHAA